MPNCAKCGNSFDEAATDPKAKTYNACQNCWNEWKTYSVMVINEMRLDMSMREHREMLRKYERSFFNAARAEPGMKDYSDESQRVPDKRPEG
jgi:Fe-S cluster biosynthesis and repair protein YggX